MLKMKINKEDYTTVEIGAKISFPVVFSPTSENGMEQS